MGTPKTLRRRGTALVEYAHKDLRGVLVHADHEGNWLLPGGGLNRDKQTGDVIESRLAAAARELREETGLEGYAVTFLFRHETSYSDHKVFYVLARGVARIVDEREARRSASAARICRSRRSPRAMGLRQGLTY